MHCNQNLYAPTFSRQLQHGLEPRRRYVPRQPRQVFSIRHLGQRKLFMGELEILSSLDPTVFYTLVYAGAAPGIHIPLLSELFPNIRFHLYDPGHFEIEGTERISLYNMYFTDDEALSYADVPNLIFICDIRRGPEELMVWEDMQAQQRWHIIMRPMLTSLKFRLPWPDQGVVYRGARVTRDNPQITYLDGHIHLPIWGRTQTTDCRLIIDERFHYDAGRQPKMRVYDCAAYEEEMCYFNRVVRPSVHRQPIQFGGLDGCYDCTAEVFVLNQFIVSRHDTRSVMEMSALVTARLRRGIN